MALYTELLSEYLENGGELPTVFDEIDGFEDLFTGHFCDHEIGFETEALFAVKLETKANLVVPVYKDRIDKLEALKEQFAEPEKVRETVKSVGKKTGIRWELPMGDGESLVDATEHTEQTSDDDKDTTTESGLTNDEIARQFELFNGKVRVILNELLHEFDDLFMMIY